MLKSTDVFLHKLLSGLVRLPTILEIVCDEKPVEVVALQCVVDELRIRLIQPREVKILVVAGGVYSYRFYDVDGDLMMVENAGWNLHPSDSFTIFLPEVLMTLFPNVALGGAVDVVM